MVIAFITRGICPAECLYEAMTVISEGSRHELILVSGMPLVEAKNYAVQYALDVEDDLLLLEDDIIAPPEIWDEALVFFNGEKILFADAVERSGRINVRYNKAGDLLWTGNVFTVIPYEILNRLEKPVFRSWNFVRTGDGSELIDRGPAKHGNHSDAYFWWTVQKLDPKPQIEYIGRVQHMKTPYNTGVTEHSKPYKMKPFVAKEEAKQTA